MTKDKDTGYWYNSDKWRDKSSVFGIFDVLPDEARATPEGVRSGPKAASNKQKRQQKKRERYQDDGNRYIQKAKSNKSDEEIQSEEKQVLWNDVKEKLRSASARKTKKCTNEPWKYSHPTTLPKQKFINRAGKHKDAYYLDSGASIHILFNQECLGDID